VGSSVPHLQELSGKYLNSSSNPSLNLINCVHKMSKVEFSESLLDALKDQVVIVTGISHTELRAKD